MYRRRNGSLSFSFSRFITAAVPNFAGSGPGYTEVTPQRLDMLYLHQMSGSTPLNLGPDAFHVAGICDRRSQSQRIYEALQKNGVLSANGSVDTNKIGPKFIHQLAFVDEVSQKKLINVLFFWEEEMQRLRKLQEEEDELDSMIARAETDGGMSARMETSDQMQFARERVRMKKRQPPSQRRPDIEEDRDNTVQDAFQAKSGGGVQLQEGLPPAYDSTQRQDRSGSVA